VSCGTSRVVPGAHRVVGPGTHRGSGPREVHTTYIKQQFLSGAKKDRSGKVTLNQDFELPEIKLNKDKVEVIPTVSQASPPNLVTQLTAITDRFERAFND
jgi:hypothetical protein